MAEYNLRTLGNLLGRAQQGEIELPAFQREFVWTLRQQRSLAASLLLQIPIGSLLIVDADDQSFAHRPLGNIQPGSSIKKGLGLLLDGQQRLTSVQALVGDNFGGTNWKDYAKNVDTNLKFRWGLRLEPKTDDEDYFGFREFWYEEGSLPEPEDLAPRFVQFKMNVSTRKPDWWHPGFRIGKKGSTSAVATQRTKAIIDGSSATGIVPLWGLMSSDKTMAQIHQWAVDAIGSRQVSVLEAAIASGEASQSLIQRVETQVEVFGAESTREALQQLKQIWCQKIKDLIERLITTSIPIVELPESELHRAIVIFESMNQGGTPLGTFDLVTAKLVRSDPNLNLTESLTSSIVGFSLNLDEKMQGSLGVSDHTWRPSDSGIGVSASGGELTKHFKDSFLISLALSKHFEISGKSSKAKVASKIESVSVSKTKKKEVLDLKSDEIARHYEGSATAVLRSWAFLQARCGVRSDSDLRNELLVAPLSVVLGDSSNFKDRVVWDRLEYWYWASVLTGSYAQRQNEQAVKDLQALLRWRSDGWAPNLDPFQERASNALCHEGYSDFKTLHPTQDGNEVETDVGRYLLQYELSRFPVDMLPLNPGDEPQRIFPWSPALQDHHIVPLGSATTIGQSTKDLRKKKGQSILGRQLNSPLNRTFITDAANRMISDLSIEQYFKGVPQGSLSMRNINFVRHSSESISEDIGTQLTQLLTARYQALYDMVTTELTILRSTT